ncbi:MAG: hypothetical protein IMW89_04170 [Ktedonobacteraceae bacterium]|nr:hypothetical protein [Ktedonobacteraceae bacterium]
MFRSSSQAVDSTYSMLERGEKTCLTLTALQLVGGVLLGIATIRAGIFAPWIGWLLIVSAVLSAAAFPLGEMLTTVLSGLSDLTLFIALGWSGYVLLQGERTPVQEAPSPTFSGAAGSQD